MSTPPVGGTSLGANVALETAVLAPERVRGLLREMPVLDNALEAGLVAFAPSHALGAVRAAHGADRARGEPRRTRGLVPFWTGIALATLDQRPAAMAATIHGILVGRIAPSSRARRQIDVPAMVVGHPSDPIHPAADAAMLAAELPRGEFVETRSVREWRARPERLDSLAAAFVGRCHAGDGAADTTDSRTGA